jgi:hypothetical protein
MAAGGANNRCLNAEKSYSGISILKAVSAWHRHSGNRSNRVLGSGPQTDKHMPQSPCIGQFF